MLQWNYTHQLIGGMKIIVDKFCYTEKRKYRAVAIAVDIRRPNRVKPMYKRKLFIERKPSMYMVKGLGIVMHPEIYAMVQRKMDEMVIEQERKMIFAAFGMDTSPQPKGLTMADLRDAENKGQ